MLHTYIFINYCHLKGQGLLTGDDTWSSTPDPSCSSEKQGEVKNLPRSVGILSSRDVHTLAVLLLVWRPLSRDGQQGKSGTGNFFFLSMPPFEPERGSCGLPSWLSKPSPWGWTKLAPKAAEAFSVVRKLLSPFLVSELHLCSTTSLCWEQVWIPSSQGKREVKSSTVLLASH